MRTPKVTKKKTRNCTAELFADAHKLKNKYGSTPTAIAVSLGFDANSIYRWLKYKTFAEYQAYKQEVVLKARQKKATDNPQQLKPSKAPETSKVDIGLFSDQPTVRKINNDPRSTPIKYEKPPVETDKLLQAVVEELKRLTQAVYVLKTSIDANTNKRRLF